MQEVIKSSELVVNYIKSLLKTYREKNIILEFFISHNCLFLQTEYKKGANKLITTKTKFNMEFDEIDIFYLKLYELFKQEFINNRNIKVQISKNYDYNNYENPYLSFKVHDLSLNEIDLRMRNLGNLVNTLDEIENDILGLYKKNKTK